MTEAASQSRACPFCSSDMPADAILCPACGKFSQGTKTSAPAPSILDRCNEAIAAWEARNSVAVQHVAVKTQKPTTLPGWFRIGTGLALLVIGLVCTMAWLRPNGGFNLGRTALAFLVIAGALLLGQRVFNEPSDQRQPHKLGSPAITLAGYTTNIAVAQLIGLLAMIVFAFRGDIDQAWWAGMVVVALTAVLFGSTARVPAIVMGVIAAVTVLGLWAVDDFGFRTAAMQRSRAMGEFFIPIGTLTSIIAVIAIVPLLQLLRLGHVGIGRFKGDFTLRLFGSAVPVSVGSAVMLASLYGAVTALPHVPWIIGVALGA